MADQHCPTEIKLGIISFYGRKHKANISHTALPVRPTCFRQITFHRQGRVAWQFVPQTQNQKSLGHKFCRDESILISGNTIPATNNSHPATSPILTRRVNYRRDLAPPLFVIKTNGTRINRQRENLRNFTESKNKQKRNPSHMAQPANRSVGAKITATCPAGRPRRL